MFPFKKGDYVYNQLKNIEKTERYFSVVTADMRCQFLAGRALLPGATALNARLPALKQEVDYVAQ